MNFNSHTLDAWADVDWDCCEEIASNEAADWPSTRLMTPPPVAAGCLQGEEYKALNAEHAMYNPPWGIPYLLLQLIARLLLLCIHHSNGSQILQVSGRFFKSIPLLKKLPQTLSPPRLTSLGLLTLGESSSLIERFV